MACTCVYATAENSESVRKGYEMGGYLKQQCDECLLAEAKALDEAYVSAADMPAERYNRDLLALVQAARAVVSRNHRGGDTTTERQLRDALDQFEPWLEAEETPQQMGWVDDKGRP